MACQRGFSRSLGSELLVGEAERTKTYMSCAEHLVNRQTCLKESFNPDPTSNYVDVKPEQLELVTVDQFYITTITEDSSLEPSRLFHEMKCQNTMLNSWYPSHLAQ